MNCTLINEQQGASTGARPHTKGTTMTQEILTPTEKLKALRNIAKQLTGGLGKVVTYDDETTEALMQEVSEKHAVTLLQTIHDDDHADVIQATYYQLTGENL